MTRTESWLYDGLDTLLMPSADTPSAVEARFLDRLDLMLLLHGEQQPRNILMMKYNAVCERYDLRAPVYLYHSSKLPSFLVCLRHAVAAHCQKVRS